MKKVINPCMCDVYGRTTRANAFVKIEYKEGRLSLSGVVGPLSNGNCRGSAGQCVDEIRKGTPTKEWTAEMIETLCNIWDRWHLNDMHPYCEHQRELGWIELAREEIKLYHYRLTDSARKAKSAVEAAAIDALKNGMTFTPTEEQTFLANLENSIDTYYELSDKLSSYYQNKKPLYAGDKGAVETKTRGWVRYDECEKGILCKPCPVCGYRYGTAWQKEEVPQEVIDFLFSLPDTETQPAWV